MASPAFVAVMRAGAIDHPPDRILRPG